MSVDLLHRRGGYDQLLLAALRRHPARTAFVAGDRRMSYRDTEQQIAGMATVLRRSGVSTGDGVALVAGNRPEAFTTMAAAWALGARFTPLHPLGSVDDQEYMVRDAAARVLVFDVALFGERAAELARRVPGLLLLGLGPSELAEDILGAAGEPDPLRDVTEESDLAVIGYTGGTTGRPKGVMLSHRALLHNATLTLTEWQLPEDVRFLGVTPLSHALALCVVPTLLRGGTFVLLPGFDPGQFLRTVAEQRITATCIVPTMLYVLLDSPELRTADTTSLQTIVYGASPIDVGRLGQALERFGPVFVQSYGQSEAPNTVACLRKEDHALDRPEVLSSCGKPLPGNTVAVLDENDEPVADGGVGEVCVRGPLVMEGYWGLPDLTAQTLRNDWLHTGDLGRMDDEGYLHLVDRTKDMVITGGFNVYPRELEDVLSGHAGVALAAVVGVPDPKWGEAVAAFVVPAPGAAVREEELIALVRERKGPVSAPKTLTFVDALPLTPLGKVDKRRLRALAASGQL